MYEVQDDKYCYPKSSVLKNKLGIRDQIKLSEFELAMTTQRFDEPLPNGRLGTRHYFAVHKHLFQDVYSWAGKPRTVRISKGTSMFCCPENILSELKRLFENLRDEHSLRNLESKEFSLGAARFLSGLSAIHAFRDGNGRAQMAFLALLAIRAGHPLDLSRLHPDSFLAAMIASFHGDEEPLAKQIEELT
jgi:cell filamentation protein